MCFQGGLVFFLNSNGYDNVYSARDMGMAYNGIDSLCVSHQ